MSEVWLVVLILLAGIGGFSAGFLWGDVYAYRRTARARDGEVAALEREVAFLREQVGILTDHRRRMERVGRGLSEMEPRRVDPGTKTGPALSPNLQAYLLSFESGPMRHAALRSIDEALLAGSTCEQIEADIEPEVWAALGITTERS